MWLNGSVRFHHQRRAQMRTLLVLILSIATFTTARAVDYQQLGESVDTEKAMDALMK
jgi:hypothetical protein